jgi:hypothetical protein
MVACQIAVLFVPSVRALEARPRGAGGTASRPPRPIEPGD